MSEWQRMLDGGPARWRTVIRQAARGAGRGARAERHAARLLGRRSPDGGLIGWKMLLWGGCRRVSPYRGRLVSPHRGTLWEGPTLMAEVWPADPRLANAPGIHAYARRSECMEELLRNSACVPVGWWAILVRVRGYGRYVTGTYQGGVPGWRAERVVIDRLDVPQDVPAEIVAALAERYQCAVRIHHGWSAGLPCPGWDPAVHG